MAIGDSGTTDVLLRASDSSNLTDIFPCPDLRVSLPNGAVIRSTHAGTLHINGTDASLPAYVFPDNILQHSLISFSALCNADCTVMLTKSSVSITNNKNDSVIFRGSKKDTDTLWLIDLDILRQGHFRSMANLSVKLETNAEFVAFVHATFGSPPSSTFLHAARHGWLAGFPRISASMIASNMVNSIATAKGHLDQTRQRNRPRRPVTFVEDSTTVPSSASAISDEVFVQSVPFTDLAHVDLTGRFPVASRKGNQYLLVFCWDGYVHYEAMPSRKA